MTTLSMMSSGGLGGLRTAAVCLALCAVAAIVTLMMLAIPTSKEAPAPQAIRPRTHAVERHGASALTARLAVRQCGNGLKVYQCPETRIHAPTFIYLCEAVGGTDCAGVIVGSLGAEFTAWVGPCNRWEGITTACNRTTVQAAPVIVWATPEPTKEVQGAKIED